MFQDLEKNVSKVKQSSIDLSLVTPNQRKNCLSLLSEKLDSNKAKIIEINKEEITQALKSGLDNHVLDRMRLSEDSIDRMIDSLVTVRDMPDTVSEIIETNKRSNGLIVNKVRVPLGVLGVIFESRPNVVIEIAESQFNDNIEVDFAIDFNCNHGFNSYVEAKKKMDALIELKDKSRKWRETQYKIIQIPFNSAFDTPKKTA